MSSGINQSGSEGMKLSMGVGCVVDPSTNHFRVQRLRDD